MDIMEYSQFQELSEQSFWVKMIQVTFPTLSEVQVPKNVNFGSFPHQAQNVIKRFRQHYLRNGCMSTAGEHLHTCVWIYNSFLFRFIK